MLYTVKQTIKQLGIGRTHLYSFIKSGELPVVKLGRRTMIEREMLVRFIEQKRITQAKH